MFVLELKHTMSDFVLDYETEDNSNNKKYLKVIEWVYRSLMRLFEIYNNECQIKTELIELCVLFLEANRIYYKYSLDSFYKKELPIFSQKLVKELSASFEYELKTTENYSYLDRCLSCIQVNMK